MEESTLYISTLMLLFILFGILCISFAKYLRYTLPPLKGIWNRYLEGLQLSNEKHLEWIKKIPSIIVLLTVLIIWLLVNPLSQMVLEISRIWSLPQQVVVVFSIATASLVLFFPTMIVQGILYWYLTHKLKNK